MFWVTTVPLLSEFRKHVQAGFQNNIQIRQKKFSTFYLMTTPENKKRDKSLFKSTRTFSCHLFHL